MVSRQSHRPSLAESGLLESADTVMKMMEEDDDGEIVLKPSESFGDEQDEESDSDDDEANEDGDGMRRRPSLKREGSRKRFGALKREDSRKRFGGFLKNMGVEIMTMKEGMAALSKPTVDLQKVAVAFQKVVIVRDRSKKMKGQAKSRKNVFVGREAVTSMVWYGLAETRQQAVEIGRRLMDELDLFAHVKNDHGFCDKKYSYRFNREITGTASYVPKPSVLAEKAEEFRTMVNVEDRKLGRRTHKRCFVGKEAVDVILNLGMAKTRLEAVELGRKLETELRLFKDVSGDHKFKDAEHLYEFRQKDRKEAMYNTKTDDRLREKKSLERFYAQDDSAAIGTGTSSRPQPRRSQSSRNFGGNYEGISKLSRHGERGPRLISVISGIENTASYIPCQRPSFDDSDTESGSDSDSSDSSSEEFSAATGRPLRRSQSLQTSSVVSAPKRQTSISSRSRMASGKDGIALSDHVGSSLDTDGRVARRNARLRRSQSFATRPRSHEDLGRGSRTRAGQIERQRSVRRSSSDEDLGSNRPKSIRRSTSGESLRRDSGRPSRSSSTTSQNGDVRQARSSEGLRRESSSDGRRSRSRDGLRRESSSDGRRSRSREGLRREGSSDGRRSRSSERLSSRSRRSSSKESLQSQSSSLRRSKSNEGLRRVDGGGIRRTRSNEGLRSSRRPQRTRSNESLRRPAALNGERRRTSDQSLLDETIKDLKISIERSLSTRNLNSGTKTNNDKMPNQAIAAS